MERYRAASLRGSSRESPGATTQAVISTEVPWSSVSCTGLRFDDRVQGVPSGEIPWENRRLAPHLVQAPDAGSPASLPTRTLRGFAVAKPAPDHGSPGRRVDH